MAAAVYKDRCGSTPASSPKLTRLVPLAPLHQPHHLAAIAAMSKLHPTLPQVACFDTSFHHTQPEVAAAFALPRASHRRGSSPLRIPRPVLRIHRQCPARCRSAAGREGPGGGRPSRQWRQHVRHEAAQERRHHDGVHRARWAADGSALRQSRSRRRALSDGREEHDGRAPSATCFISHRGCSAFLASATT